MRVCEYSVWWVGVLAFLGRMPRACHATCAALMLCVCECSSPSIFTHASHVQPNKQLEELSKSLRAERDDKARLLQESTTLRTRLAEATEELGEAQRQLLKKGEEGEEWRCVGLCCLGVMDVYAYIYLHTYQ